MGLSLKPTKKPAEGSFEQPPAGTHDAVVVGLIELGTHPTPFKNKDGSQQTRRIVMLAWELVDEEMSGYKGRNWVVGKDFTFSLNEDANLRKFLLNMRGEDVDEDGFEFDELRGFKCLLTITTEAGKTNPEKKYNNVTGASKPGKKAQIDNPQHKPFFWELPDPGTPKAQIEQAMASLIGASVDWLPRFYGKNLSEVVMRSEEWISLTGVAPAPATARANPPADNDELHDRF